MRNREEENNSLTNADVLKGKVQATLANRNKPPKSDALLNVQLRDWGTRLKQDWEGTRATTQVKINPEVHRNYQQNTHTNLNILSTRQWPTAKPTAEQAEQIEASAGLQEQAAAREYAGSNLPKTENFKSGGVDWSVYVRSPEQMAASTAEAKAQQQQTRENIAQKGQAEGGWADIGPQDFGKAIAKDVANYQGIKREATRARESGTPGAGDAWKQFMEAQNNLVGQALSWIEGQVQRQSGSQFQRMIATGPGKSRLSYSEPIEQYRARVQGLASVASSVLPQELKGAVEAFGDDLTYQRAAEDRASADWRTILADQRMRESDALFDKRWKADFGLRQAEIADAHNRGSAFPTQTPRNIDPNSPRGVLAFAEKEAWKQATEMLATGQYEAFNKFMDEWNRRVSGEDEPSAFE